MVCDIPWAPTICTDFDTHLNPSIGTWMRRIHHYTINQAMGSHPYWPHNTHMIYHWWIDENWGTFILCLGLCDIPWSTIVNIDINTTLNSSMDAWVRLIHHYTGKQTRGSHPYWSYIPNNVQCMDGWKLGHFHPLPWMVCDVLWAPTIHTGVDILVNPSMDIWVALMDTTLHEQPSKEVTFILVTQHQKDGWTWRKVKWHMFSLYLGWCVIYHELQPPK
jgi:hypothetical protein